MSNFWISKLILGKEKLIQICYNKMMTKTNDKRILLIITNNLLEGMDPSFCKASFKFPLPLMLGSLCSPSAAAKIVI